MLTAAILSGIVFTLGFFIYRADYDTIAREQKELLLAETTQRVLEPGELIPERMKLDADARRLPGFTRLGDFVEIYSTTRLHDFSKNPYRALVDDEGTTVALIFRMAELVQQGKWKVGIAYRDDTTRVSLSTAFSDGRWTMTQKTFGLANQKPVFPAEIDIQDFDWEIPLDELVAKHAARVAAATDHQEEGYRGAASAEVVILRTLDEYLVDHRKRRELIRTNQQRR